MLVVRRIINKPVPSNCYVLYDNIVGGNCVIIDPGSRLCNTIVDFIFKKGLKPRYIILSHEHFDHCWSVNQLVNLYRIPIVCSQLCAEAIKDKKKNCSIFFDSSCGFTIKNLTISVESLDFLLRVGNTNLRFFRTPGHTDASICILVEHYLFTGDTLIKNLPTVTKLPTGSNVKLEATISFFESLQGNGYEVYPGHDRPFLLDGYNLNKSRH